MNCLRFGSLANTIVIVVNQFSQQAKTTKKIVLRLQCQGCKHVSQHPIKVGSITLDFICFFCFGCCKTFFCELYICIRSDWWFLFLAGNCRGANTLRLVETRRGREHLCFRCSFCFNVSLFYFVLCYILLSLFFCLRHMLS